MSRGHETRGQEPAHDDDLDQYLAKCVRNKRLNAAIGIEEATDEVDKALLILKWANEQPSFKGQYVDPRTLYQAARMDGKPRPKLNRRNSKFEHELFDFFYKKLCRAASRVYKEGAILLKQKVSEVVNPTTKTTKTRKGDAPQPYTVEFYLFRYSTSQDDRISLGHEPIKRTVKNNIERMIRSHRSIPRADISKEHQILWDTNDKLVDYLEAPRLHQLFKPQQLLIQNGVIGDPRPRSK